MRSRGMLHRSDYGRLPLPSLLMRLVTLVATRVLNFRQNPIGFPDEK